MTDRERLDKIKGSLIGGAAGDALGNPVEFMKAKEIFAKYGPEGITSFELCKRGPSKGKALITDDTQMTLFTATGLMTAEARSGLYGTNACPEAFINRAYRVWYKMQMNGCPQSHSWLAEVPEMGELRAPGNTCLSALAAADDTHFSTIENPYNTSKGCGGVMRVAPIALYLNRERVGSSYDKIEMVDDLGAKASALTHGHDLGYTPSAYLCHVINRVTYGGMTLLEAIEDASETIGRMYAVKPHTQHLLDMVDDAVKRALRGKDSVDSDSADVDDVTNIHAIGGGWVAEEALAVALYCSVRYQDDFEKCLIAAVNHSGDSDSTGAIAGNILGAIHGYDALPDKWKTNLECEDVILEIAEDLSEGCRLAEFGDFENPAWECKYFTNRRYL